MVEIIIGAIAIIYILFLTYFTVRLIHGDIRDDEKILLWLDSELATDDYGDFDLWSYLGLVLLCIPITASFVGFFLFVIVFILIKFWYISISVILVILGTLYYLKKRK